MDICLLDLADERGVDAAYDVTRAAATLDLPDEPPPGRRAHRAGLRIDWGGETPKTWLARQGGRVTGVLTITLPSYDNPHLALPELTVHPDDRRCGVGTALVRHAQEVARAAGRRLLVLEMRSQTPGPAFAAALGAACGLVEVRRVLDLATINPTAHERLRTEAAERAGGYGLLRWAGPVPGEHLEDMAVLSTQMSDAPVDDLDWQGEFWTPQRLRRAEEGLAEAGTRLYTVAARDPASGRLVAFTSVFVPQAHPAYSEQGATLVLPAHRGRRLGLAVKLAMLAWLPEVEPEVRQLATGNAGSNSYMIAINDALGYRISGGWQEWQLPTGPG